MDAEEGRVQHRVLKAARPGYRNKTIFQNQIVSWPKLANGYRAFLAEWSAKER